LKPIIRVEKVSKKFAGKTIFHEVSFDVYAGEILVLMGASGVGKSTLLNLIGQLDSDFEGSIKYDESVFEGNQIPFPFVFQESESLLPWKTVEDNIRLVKGDFQKDSLDEILHLVSLESHRYKMPHELSGGMKQRVGIARALVCHSKVLLMDEPFSSLDLGLRTKLQDLIIDIKKQRGLTVIFVTHDLEEAKRIGDRVISLCS